MGSIRFWSPVVCLAVLMVLVAAGCPRPTNGMAKVTTVFTAAEAPKAAYASALLSDPKNLDLSEVESLLVTVTEVVLDRCEDVEEEESEAKDECGDKVSVFTGAVDVDLVDLMGVSEILSSVDVPAGAYTKIRLSIENPRLVRASDPETVHTNVHLTANGRVFINGQFELEAGEQHLLVLDMGGIHIAELGNGGFVLTPQLRATLQVTSAAASVTGVIESIDETAGTLILALTEGTVEVAYTGASIYLESDTDTPTGTVADLLPGVEVQVNGTLFLDGSIAADTIVVLPAV